MGRQRDLAELTDCARFVLIGLEGQVTRRLLGGVSTPVDQNQTLGVDLKELVCTRQFNLGAL